MTCSTAFSPKCCAWLLVAMIGLAGVLAGAPAGAQAPVTVVAASSTPELEQLLARFAAMSGLSAKFREEKRMALLAMDRSSVSGQSIRLAQRSTANYGQSTRTLSIAITSFVKRTVSNDHAYSKKVLTR